MTAWGQMALHLRGLEIRLGVLRRLRDQESPLHDAAALARCEQEYGDALRGLIALATAALLDGSPPAWGEGG